MSDFWKWSKTQANNATVALPDINWQENQAPSTVNNSSRGEMSHLARYRDDTSGVAVVVAGTSDELVLTSNIPDGVSDPPPDGYTISWPQPALNTTEMGIVVDGTTRRQLKPNTADEFDPDSFDAGELITAIYNASLDFYVGRGSKKSRRVGLDDLDPSIAGALVAPGTIIPWSLDTLPAGWFECNGQALNKATYADLDAIFSADGYPYGSTSTTFDLPDYRGRFMRGQDSGSGRDPDVGSRADRGDGTTDDNVGTTQADQFDNHLHAITGSTTTGSALGSHSHTYTRPNSNINNSVIGGGSSYLNNTSTASTSSVNLSHTHSVTVPPNTETSGGNETRPINIYVTYIIFASPALASGNIAKINTIWNEENAGGTPTGSIGSIGDFLIDPVSGDANNYYIWGPKLLDNDWSTSDQVDLIPGVGGGGGSAATTTYDPTLNTYGAAGYAGDRLDVQLALDDVGARTVTNLNNIALKANIDDPTFTTGITTPLLTMADGGANTHQVFEGTGGFTDWDLIHAAGVNSDLAFRRFDATGANEHIIMDFKWANSEVIFPRLVAVDRQTQGIDAFLTIIADSTNTSELRLTTPSGLQWSVARAATTDEFQINRYIDGVFQNTVLDIDNATGATSFNSPTDFTAAVTFQTTATGGAIAVSEAAGSFAEFRAQSALSDRWTWGKDSSAESTGNAGSDFALRRYTDAGALIDTVLETNRATGQTAFNHSVIMTDSTGEGFTDYVEQGPAPGDTPSNTGRLYTIDVSGSTHLIFKNAPGQDQDTGLDISALGTGTGGEDNILNTPGSVVQDDRLDRAKTGLSLNLKRFVAGTGITITSTNSDEELTFTSTGGGGTGNVVGPASATDEALARYDTTTGELLQDSPIVVTDLGDMSGVNNITGTLGAFVTGSSGSVGTGAVWDASGNLTGTGTPVGDVAGPAGATDHAVARYDTTTGKLLQDSAVLIDDAGSIGQVLNYQGTGNISTSGQLIEVKHSSANDVSVGIDTLLSNSPHIDYQSSGDSRWKVGRQAATDDYTIERWTGGAGGSLASTPLNIDTATGNAIFAHDWQINGALAVAGVNSFADYTDILDIVEPGAVGANTGRLYSKDVGGNSHLFFKNDGDFSTATDLTQGGSGGSAGPSLGTNSVIRTNATNIIEDITVWDHDMTVTADTGANTLSAGTDNNFLDGDTVQLITTGTLPAPLSLATTYYVLNITATTCQLSATFGGAAIALTTTGTGTHTLYQAINGMSAGPIEVESGFTVTVATGSTYTVI